MTKHHDEIFAPLEPPSGGVERFRAKLAAESASRRHSYGRPAAALVAVAVVLSLSSLIYLRFENRVEPAASGAIYDSPELDRLLGRESRAMPLRVEIDDKVVAVEQLASTDPQVRIYQLP
jgi:hypothetical protein